MQQRAMRAIPAHFTPVRRLGFPDGVKCWCGAVYAPSAREKHAPTQCLAFVRLHEECEYQPVVAQEESPERVEAEVC